ncbi:TPA: hypothetical protein PJH94_001021 [Raoultella planticola]|nr:hypothetical protein [Raoultella planticola]
MGDFCRVAAGGLPDLRSGLGAGIALTGCGVDAMGDFCRVAAGALPDLRGGLGAGIALTGYGVDAIGDFCRVAPYPTCGGGLGPELL